MHYGHIFSHFMLLPDIEYSSLCYAVGSCLLCISYIVACVRGEGEGTHSSILAWKIPWMEEPGGLQSMGLQRVRHERSALACTHAHILMYIISFIHSPVHGDLGCLHVLATVNSAAMNMGVHGLKSF